MKAIITACLFIVAASVYSAGQLEDAPAPQAEWKSKNPDPLTPAWLERGLICCMLASKKDGTLTKDQDKYAVQVLYLHTALLTGINHSCFLTEENNPLQFPNPGMMDIGASAPSILQFMEQHRDKFTEKTSALDVLFGWYLWSHSDSTPKHKALGDVILSGKTN